MFFSPPSNADIGADHYDENVKAYGDVYHDYICSTIRMADTKGEINILAYNIMRDMNFNADQTASTIMYTVNVYCPWQMGHLGQLVGAVTAKTKVA